ncbi:hypothetical protein PV518_46765 [Streptomyces sp. ND04-05B]|uniref:hypothetical protein n=1 Tax=Streptomyces sp. ND04-05B TaxID=3028693 RepID=UPI0029AB9373|nr:hypothetical protein [Streptomyces sp. ND04-05B]MDX3069545.1 hypothetical protein [Streptomyces sp. ND04-05B]
MTTIARETPSPEEGLKACEPAVDTSGLTADQAHEPNEPEPREPEPHELEPDDDEPGEWEPERIPALMIPNLRPYADPKALASLARRSIKVSRKPATSLGRRLLPALGKLGATLLAGSRILGRLIWGWATGAYGKAGSIPARFGGVAVLLYMLARSLGEWPAPTLIAVAWCWCLAALSATRGAFDRLLKKTAAASPKGAKKNGRKPKKGGKKKTQTKLTKEPAPALTDNPGEAPAEDVTEPPLMALVRELIGGDNGVHLNTLRPAMRERLPGLAEATDQQLRQVLVAAGWDPSRTFRAGGVAGRAGIHRDQLPPFPFPGDGPGTRSPETSGAESGPDLRKSPEGESSGEDPESTRRVPDGWTDEDHARGYRWVNDAERGPSAWTIERLPDK